MGNEIRQILHLAWPILIAQLSLSAMGLTDTIMAGHYNKVDLAAIAIGGSVWLPALLFTNGCLLALAPIVAQALGRGDADDASRSLHQGVLTGCIIGLLVALVVMALLPLMVRLQVDSAVVSVSQQYLGWILLGLPFAGAYQALRSYVEAHGLTKLVMIVNVSALLINIPLNYVFIFGKLGAPELGAEGCGVASALVLLLMFLAMLICIRASSLRKDAFSAIKLHIDCHKQKQILVVGLPIGFSILAEVGIFAVLALMIAPLGIDAVAGHQIALSVTSQTFMLPLSLSTALTIRIGYFLGKKELSQAAIVAKAGITLAIFTSILTSIVIYLAAPAIAASYSNDALVQSAAVALLFFAAVYQLPDAIQICSAGILRGFKKTALPMISIIVTYWGVAVPCGYWLAFSSSSSMGAQGLWLGLVLGLSLAAILLSAQALKAFAAWRP